MTLPILVRMLIWRIRSRKSNNLVPTASLLPWKNWVGNRKVVVSIPSGVFSRVSPKQH